jgi:hypothetical protein
MTKKGGTAERGASSDQTMKAILAELQKRLPR